MKRTITLEELDLNLSEGVIALKNLEIDERELNALLVASGSRLRVSGGTISKLQIKVPYADILTNPVVVELDEVEITMCLDTDGDGVELEEVAQIVKDIDPAATPEQVATLFEAADSDGSGVCPGTRPFLILSRFCD